MSLQQAAREDCCNRSDSIRCCDGDSDCQAMAAQSTSWVNAVAWLLLSPLPDMESL
ncbi:hypothetical protein CERZMDRAFT_90851 [Cercospora zeae-maydis SCOH1-5]|uniref:Uncharacterized protein n=1 Tax=Cercospora zeae-maydis SCOH1-5 TaxID=717836 RepID=A0A6A6FE42_9PEZI|nr:hypothetical protein CERZMDRAFT_90851 [Cercospora zeae-maydis SCOH1-5]